MRLFILILMVAIVTGCKHEKESNVIKFYSAFNNKNIDSLSNMYTEDFQFIFGFISNDTLKRLNKNGYVIISKYMTDRNHHIEVEDIKGKEDTLIATIATSDNLSNYLNFTYPDIQEKFVFNENKIKVIVQDTLPGFYLISQSNDIIIFRFELWLLNKYKRSLRSLSAMEEEKYLKEYKEDNVKTNQ